MEKTTYIPVDVIHSFMIDVFETLGTPPDDARICADVLTASDLLLHTPRHPEAEQ